ncbi:MAG: DUF4124 domain-containing protein [Polaromonas sp.]|nr:DUF4124 domain-containing protein [Polaromonas sp.]
MFVPGHAMSQGIYVCTDAKGRKITSDRPISECMDRTQQEVTPSGTVKRVLGPSLTAQERAVQEEKDKQTAEVRAREAEDKRRDRALLLRYPTRAVHDKERGLALAQIDEVIKAATKRTLELAEQRKAIGTEMEFYIKDPSKAPASLKRRIEENDSSIAVSKRFIADQDMEKQRVNLRFDEELVKLKQLWTLMGLPSTGTPTSVTTPAGINGAASDTKSASKN